MKKTALGAVMALTLAMPAAAATVSYSEMVEYGFSPTDWAQSLSVAQFDASLGTLMSVAVELTGDVEGSAQATNAGASSVDAILDLSATIRAVSGPVSVDITVEPIHSQTVTIAAGETVNFDNLMASAVATQTLTGAAMSGFVGAGDVDFDVTSAGTSTATASGNFGSLFRSDAKATLKVTYTYDNAVSTVPLPASAPLVLAGLGMLGMMRLGRRSA